MKRLILAIAVAALTLPAMAAVSASDTPILRTKKVDEKSFTVQLVNLQQERAYIRIEEIDGGTLFSKFVTNHNGYKEKFDFSNLEAGRYLLSVNHLGVDYNVVVYVSEDQLMLSEVAVRD